MVNLSEPELQVDVQKRATFSSLPFELLEEIFLRCIPASYTIRVNHPPWTLAKVCRLWRNTCLSSPVLWINIPAVSINSSQGCDLRYQGLVCTMLKLSDPLPLSLHLIIHTPLDRRNQDYKTPSSMLAIIASHKDRISSLKLSVDIRYIQQLKVFSNMASITNLQIRFWGRFLESDLQAKLPPYFLREASVLRTLQLTNLNPPIHAPSLIKFPSSKLVSYTATTTSYQYIFDVLSNAPLLQECHIHDIGFVYQQESNLHIVHGNLSRLGIFSKLRSGADIPDTFPFDFLSRLTLPSLKELIVEYRDDHVGTLVSFIERSNCHFTKLVSHCSRDKKELMSTRLSPYFSDLHAVCLFDLDASDLKLLYSPSIFPSLRQLAISKPSMKYVIYYTALINQRASWPAQVAASLHSLTLIVGRKDHAYGLFYLLEGWRISPMLDSEYQELIRLKRRLECIPNTLPSHVKQAQLNDVRMLVKELEGCESISSKYIFTSAICSLFPRVLEILQDDPYAFRMRKIIDEWTRKVAEYVHSPRWILKSRGDDIKEDAELIYITKIGREMDDDLRRLQSEHTAPASFARDFN